MLDQRRRRSADVVKMFYKSVVLAGQVDFLSNIEHFSNVGSMLDQCHRGWPNIKTALGEYLVRVLFTDF